MTDTTFSEITDLADPQLTAEMRVLCARIARHDQHAALVADQLITEACEHTGLDDFGDEWFREPFELLCRSLHTEAHLSPLGAVTQRLQLHRLLCARLRVEQYVKDHPEVVSTPADPPIVIAGLPRTGTTFLHSLLAVDPALRHLTKDEAEGPPDPGAVDPAANDHQRLVDENIPLMKKMIDVDEGSTVEELSLLATSFASILFQVQCAPLTAYGEWMLGTDQTPAYRYLARVLRVLHAQRGGGPWVLKAIQHVGHLPAVAAAFPGATIVCTHRDPGAVIPSMSTLAAYGQRLMVDPVDPVRTADYWTELILRMVDRNVAHRAAMDGSRIVDATLARIRDDPDAVIREIFATAGLPLTEGAIAAMADLQEGRHPHRHGRVRYDAARLGLDLDRIRERSATYRARFDVPAES